MNNLIFHPVVAKEFSEAVRPKSRKKSENK